MSLIYASFSPTKSHPGCTGNLYPKLPKMCQFLGSFLVDTIAVIEYMCLSRNYFDINWKRKPEPTICNFVTVYKPAFWAYPLPKSKFLSFHLLSLTSLHPSRQVIFFQTVTQCRPGKPQQSGGFGHVVVRHLHGMTNKPGFQVYDINTSVIH